MKKKLAGGLSLTPPGSDNAEDLYEIKNLSSEKKLEFYGRRHTRKYVVSI